MKLNPEENGKGRGATGGARPSRGQKSSLARARSQLSQAAIGVISGSLGALEGRLSSHGWLTGIRAGSSVKHAERLREVVQRDRALFAAHPRPRRAVAQATPSEAEAIADAATMTEERDELPFDEGLSEAAPSRPATTKAAARKEAAAAARKDTAAPGGAEPIRTRTMARLLAAQGHRNRALSIYDELIEADATDPTLQAEAATLRDKND